MSKRGKIKLGDRYRDKVSGWEGIAVARYEYMNGCVRFELAATDDKGLPKGFVFDEQQIERIHAKVDKTPTRPLRRTGGPQDSEPMAR